MVRIVTGALCLALAAALEAATVVPFSLKELAQKSDAVYVVKCLAAQSYFISLTQEQERIYTNYVMQVVETLKGEDKTSIIVTERGGQVGVVLQWVPGAPSYATGEEAVIFLAKTADGWNTKGWAQGKYLISTATDTGRKIVRQDLSGLTFMNEKALNDMLEQARKHPEAVRKSQIGYTERPKSSPVIYLDDFLAQVRKYVGNRGRGR